MSKTFTSYIKCVGTGPKLNRDLSAEEMRDAMEQMLDGRAEPEQISAFLLGWRLKPESIEEYRAALKVLDERTKQSPISNGLELGYPFDGKGNHPYIFSLAAPLVAPYGITIVVNGTTLQPSKGGATVHDICTTLPIPHNLQYFDRADYCKPLNKLTNVRQKLRLRTGLNTLERLPNVGVCDTALIGIFHKPYVKKYAKIFGDRYQRLIIVKGDKGTPEVFKKSHLWVCELGKIDEIIIDPADFDIKRPTFDEKLDKEAILEMIANPSGTLQQIAKLNAAIWLFAKREALSIHEAWEMLNG
jgi:anthranilate phosphoribosyltransferase